MVLNYANGKIYKLVSDHDEQFYVGSTIQKLCQRKTQHFCKSKNPKEMGRLVYQHFNATGWQNVRIILIETYPCNSVEELVKRERSWYESLKPTLNSRFPQMDKQEYAGRYRQENRELCNARTVRSQQKEVDCDYCSIVLKAAYFFKQMAKFHYNLATKTQKERYARNLESKKKYYAENKDHHSEVSRLYRERTKEEVSARNKLKAKCLLCNKEMRKNSIHRHIPTVHKELSTVQQALD
jgi:hypothetical protein